MSEETKNPLIESFLKLHEKMIGYGGKDDPYQGRSQQKFTADKTTPDVLRVKDNEPKPVIKKDNEPKPVLKTEPSSTPIPVPKPKPENLQTTLPRPEGSPTGPGSGYTAGEPSGPKIVPTSAPSPSGSTSSYPLSLPNRTDMEKSTFNAQDIADTKDNPAALRAKLNTARQTIQGQRDSVVNTQQPDSSTGKTIPPVNPEDAKKSINFFRLNKTIDSRIPGPLTILKRNFSQHILGQNRVPYDPYNNTSSSVGSLSSRISGAVAAAQERRKRDYWKDKDPEFFYSTKKKYIPKTTINQSEETNMTNKLIDSFLQLQATNSPNLFEAAKKAKKLDPVGKEDEDIDNDGIPIKKDKHDQYLANRRKAIGKAMKEATDPNAEGIAKDKQKAPIMVPKPDYPTSKPGPTRELKGSLPKGVTVKGNTNEAVSPMANQGTSGSQTVKRDLPSAVSNYMASKRETNRVEGEPGSRQRSMIDDIKKTSFDAKTPGENVVAFGKALGGRIAEPFVKTVDAIKGYNKPESKVIKTGNNSSTVMKNEEVEQIDEALSAEHKAAIKAHVKRMWGRGEVAFGSQGGKDFVSHSDGIQKHVHSIHYKKGVPHVTHFLSMDEEVGFSESELEHIAAILEANPVAPVPDDYSGAAGGVSKRDLSDETVAEEKKTKKKTAGTGRPRGRPAGSKSGSKHGSGGDGGVETKNLAAQIRFSRPSDGHFMLKHPKTGVTKAVPAKAATEFYSKYSGAEKPAEKEAHHDAFLTKHFGGESKPKTGITLPKMPASKS